MMKLTVIVSIIAIALGLNGCAGNIAQIGPNKFTNTGFRAHVYQQANSFCSNKGLMMKPIRERKIDYQTYGIDFKCLDINSQEYKQDSMYEVGADISVKSNIKVEQN